jgi:trans-aconitate 2-methyltransferase
VTRDWDAATYHRVSSPHVEWANVLLDRLDLRGDETVLDAGCGSGRITSRLLEKVPNGRVMAVDVDAEMVELARKALPAGTVVMQSDLLELRLPEPVDVVFSTATFHWVLDHDRLFARLASVLRPSGRLVAQCGGAGNIRALLDATDEVAARPEWAPAFAGWSRPMRYAGPDETAALLEEAGFGAVRCWLEPWRVVPEDPLGYLAAVPLGAHLDRVAPERRHAFVAAVVELLPDPVTLDYVRLNLDARRPPPADYRR